MNKKGMSLVEILAVIIIMGVVAGIGTVTTVALISRQRKNATVNALNNIYSTAQNILYQARAESHNDYITYIDEDFCYTSLTRLIDDGAIDGAHYKPVGNDIYFCFNMDETWVIIDSTVSKTKPENTGETQVNSVTVTFNYSSKKFKIA